MPRFFFHAWHFLYWSWLVNVEETAVPEKSITRNSANTSYNFDNTVIRQNKSEKITNLFVTLKTVYTLASKFIVL